MGNNYNVPIQGSYSESTRTKLTPDVKFTSNELLQIINSQTSAKAIADKEAKDKTIRLSKSESAYQKRIKTGIQSSQDLADETGAIGDKISLQNLPVVGKYIPEALDVTGMIGNMASGLGKIPSDIENKNYGQAALSIATPLTVGALAGLGTQNTSQFVNNLVNPLANIENPLSKKSINTFKPQFESEINWRQWNKEIPENTQLMKEYNAIEQTSKANGSWMKNTDGSEFKGTPEQFVQQNSENFKKAFPEGSENVFRGTGENIAELRPNRSIFTANQELASGYAPFNKKSIFLNSESGEGGVHSFYRKNSKNSLELDANNTSWTSVDLSNKRLTKDYFERNIKSQEDQITKQKEYLSKMKQNPNGSWEAPDGTTYSNDLYKNTVAERELYLKDLKERYKNIDNLISNPKELEEMRKVLGNTSTTDDIATYVEKRNLDYVKLKNIEDSGVGDVTIVNHKPGNYLKSAIGNNGMFDMTNPNIYKSVVGALATGTLGKQAMEKKELGGYVRTSKSGRKFTYPSFEGQKQEIINRILTK